MLAIEINKGYSGRFHFILNRAGHNIPWGKRTPLIIVFHKSHTLFISENTSCSSYSFRHKKSLRVFPGKCKGCGVKLYKLHIRHFRTRAIGHSHSITCCHRGVGRQRIDLSRSTCSQYGDSGIDVFKRMDIGIH